MSILRYGLTRAAFEASGTNYDADRPASNVAIVDVPQRVARSIDISDGEILLNFGAGVAVLAFSIDDVNFEALEIFSGPSDTGPWTSQGTFVPAIEGYSGRLKALCLTPAFNDAWGRLVPGSPLAGTYSWGGVAGWTDFAEVPFTVSLPYNRRIDSRTERTDYGNGVYEVGVPGRPFVVLTFQGGYAMFDETAMRTAYQQLARLPEDRVMVWWEEFLGVASMYHMRRTASVSMHIDTNLTEIVDGFQLTEVC